MSQKIAKDIRRQVRAIAHEILVEEVKLALYQELKLKVDSELKQLAETVRTTLDSLNKRSKDINNYILNESVKSPIEIKAPTDTENK